MATALAVLQKHRRYEYTPLVDLKADPNVFAKDCKLYHVYGVVSNCSEIQHTNGPHYMAMLSLTDITIFDKSETLINQTGKSRIRFQLFGIQKNHLPEASIGDIIRLHRVKIGEYNSKPQGRAGNGFAWVLWRASNQYKEPTVSPTTKTYTITPDDQSKVDELSDWINTNNLLPQKYTLSTLKLDQYIDILCQVVGKAAIPVENGQCALLKVWDGSKRPHRLPDILDTCSEIYSPLLTIRDIPFEFIDQEIVTFCKERSYSIVDVLVWDNHVSSCTNIKLGDIVQLSNLHTSIFKYEVDLENGLTLPHASPDDHPIVELDIHGGGQRFNRKVKILSEDVQECQNLMETIDKALYDVVAADNVGSPVGNGISNIPTSNCLSNSLQRETVAEAKSNHIDKATTETVESQPQPGNFNNSNSNMNLNNNNPLLSSANNTSPIKHTNAPAPTNTDAGRNEHPNGNDDSNFGSPQKSPSGPQSETPNTESMVQHLCHFMSSQEPQKQSSRVEKFLTAVVVNEALEKQNEKKSGWLSPQLRRGWVGDDSSNNRSSEVVTKSGCSESNTNCSNTDPTNSPQGDNRTESLTLQPNLTHTTAPNHTVVTGNSPTVIDLHVSSDVQPVSTGTSAQKQTVVTGNSPTANNIGSDVVNDIEEFCIESNSSATCNGEAREASSRSTDMFPSESQETTISSDDVIVISPPVSKSESPIEKNTEPVTVSKSNEFISAGSDCHVCSVSAENHNKKVLLPPPQSIPDVCLISATQILKDKFKCTSENYCTLAQISSSSVDEERIFWTVGRCCHFYPSAKTAGEFVYVQCGQCGESGPIELVYPNGYAQYIPAEAFPCPKCTEHRPETQSEEFHCPVPCMKLVYHLFLEVEDDSVTEPIRFLAFDNDLVRFFGGVTVIDLLNKPSKAAALLSALSAISQSNGPLPIVVAFQLTTNANLGKVECMVKYTQLNVFSIPF